MSQTLPTRIRSLPRHVVTKTVSVIVAPLRIVVPKASALAEDPNLIGV